MTARIDVLTPPEGVPLHFRVASIGARVAAQITDLLLTGLALIALVVLLAATEVVGPNTFQAVIALVFFFIRIPYYVLTELAWNGQTLGKRILKLKVVAHDGGALTAHALVVRNLMKEAEVFLPATLVLTLDADRLVPSLLALAWTLGALAVPLFNRRQQRLGDLIAGTYVIHLPEPILLRDLAAERPAPRPDRGAFTFLPHHLDHYGAYELQTLEAVLRAPSQPSGGIAAARRKATVAAIVERIRAKIDFADAVPEAAHLDFLRAFYNAQRAHLEERRLFGDSRADKHYASGDES